MIESKHKHSVLISFDVEEFDLPREHGGEISLEEGVKVSAEGLLKILELTHRTGIKATFFVTGDFAKSRPDLVKEIKASGHEVGCHGVSHFEPKSDDVEQSRKIIEGIIQDKVYGYRQPRMSKINYESLADSGFLYDSSINPAWIPGRYNHRDIVRKAFRKNGVVEVPVSVATGARIPLFWLMLHLSPVKAYLMGARRSLKETGYFATYFHPWEFSESLMGYGAVPFYIKINSGEKMVARLEKVIMDLKKRGYTFRTYREYVENITELV